MLPPAAELARIVEQPRFTIFSACRGASHYAGRSIRSVLSQTCQDWQLVFVDDCSDDDTWRFVEAAIKDAENDPRIWRFKREPPRSWKLANFMRFWPAMRGDIIVELDGDDWFARPDALAIIAAAYDADEAVEATAGSFHGYTTDKDVIAKTQPAPKFRFMQNGFCNSVPAPRTWKRHLTQRSLDEIADVLYCDPQTGGYWRTNADIALYAPAMFWAEKIAAIEDILVEVNWETRQHDDMLEPALMQDEGERLYTWCYEQEWKANEALLRPFKADQAATES